MATAPTDLVLTPATNVVNPLKTLDDWRSLFHQLVPIIVTALVTLHLVTTSQVTLWVSVVFAIADPLLSVGTSNDRIRKVIYGLLALVQTGSILTQVTQVAVEHSNPVVAPVITAVGAAISGILGTFFTPTPTSIKAVLAGQIPGK